MLLEPRSGGRKLRSPMPSSATISITPVTLARFETPEAIRFVGREGWPNGKAPVLNTGGPYVIEPVGCACGSQDQEANSR